MPNPAYTRGKAAALNTMGIRAPVSLTKAPPSLNGASFSLSKAPQSAAPALPAKKSFNAPATNNEVSKTAFSDDEAVAALHGLGLTPVAVGADALTAPGDSWLMQPALTMGAATLMGALGARLGRRVGGGVDPHINPTTTAMGVNLNTGRIGELLGGALGAGVGAYGARRLGRHLSGDYWEREHEL